jgi:hypothetical protein
MGVATQAPNLKIQVSSVQGVTKGRRRLRRSPVTKHAVIPRLTRQPVSFFAGLLARSADMRIVKP